METIRSVSGQDAAEGDPERSPANANTRRHSHSSRVPIVGLDIASYLVACRLDVLAINRFQQQWSMLCHALDMDLERFQSGLSKVAQLIKQLPPQPVLLPSVTPTITTVPVPSPAPASAPTPVIGPLAQSEPSRSASGELNGVETPDLAGASAPRTGDSRSTSPITAPSVGPADSEAPVDRDDAVSSTESSSEGTAEVDGIAELLPSPAVRSVLSDGTPSVPRLNDRRRVSATDALPPEITDPLRLVPLSPPGSHAFLPPGLQATAVTVHNHMLPTAIAYSLSSSLYWRQMADIMQSAKQRFRDFGEECPTHDEGRYVRIMLGCCRRLHAESLCVIAILTRMFHGCADPAAVFHRWTRTVVRVRRAMLLFPCSPLHCWMTLVWAVTTQIQACLCTLAAHAVAVSL